MNYKSTQKNYLEKKIKLYEKENGKIFDQSNILQVYKREKANNKNIVLMMQPTLLKTKQNKKIFSLSGISKSEVIYCNEEGYYSIYESDRYGFNNPDYEWDAKKIDFLLVGDSYVHGACVNRPNDIASILRKSFNKSALNIGVSSAGPLTQFALLKEYLNKNVKNIIWFYTAENDNFELKEELNSEILKSYYNVNNYSQNLKYLVSENDSLLKDKMDTHINKELNKKDKNKTVKDIINYLKLRNLRRTLAPYFYETDETYLEFSKILERTKKMSNKNKSNLYFVYLPKFTEFKDKKYIDKNYYTIKKIIKKLNINFIDTRDEMINKTENPLIFFPFEQHNHFNKKGYYKISSIIFDNVK